MYIYTLDKITHIYNNISYYYWCEYHTTDEINFRGPIPSTELNNYAIYSMDKGVTTWKIKGWSEKICKKLYIALIWTREGYGNSDLYH